MENKNEFPDFQKNSNLLTIWYNEMSEGKTQFDYEQWIKYVYLKQQDKYDERITRAEGQL